jgi:hypothetical protein
MRLIVLGILLIALGGYVLLEGLSYTSERSTVRIGEVEASLEQKKAVPGWIGGIGVVAGLILVVAGGRKRAGGES